MRVEIVVAMAGTLFLATGPAQAQSIEPKQIYGHVEWREAAEERRRDLYEIATNLPFAERSFHFTAEDHLAMPAALWGEYDVQLDEEGSGRIVAELGLPDGKYAAEYYFDAGVLQLVYETRYYIAEAAPKPVSANFKGIPAWERLSIFVDDRIHYAHSGGRGAPSPGSGGSDLLAGAASLMRDFGRSD